MTELEKFENRYLIWYTATYHHDLEILFVKKMSLFIFESTFNLESAATFETEEEAMEACGRVRLNYENASVSKICEMRIRLALES